MYAIHFRMFTDELAFQTAQEGIAVLEHSQQDLVTTHLPVAIKLRLQLLIEVVDFCQRMFHVMSWTEIFIVG